MTNIDLGRFLTAYVKEIEYYSGILPNKTVNTIFFGGGTPSLMSIDSIETILNKIYGTFRIDENIEISLEANPASCEINKFREFKLRGINRLSIGIQSLEDKYLEFLGRIHSRSEALKAIEMAQRYFSDSYSIDLIYARTGQTTKEWSRELKEALELSPRHMSLYQLTIEPDTEFGRKKVKTVDESTAAEMYRVTNEFLDSSGLPLYEVSNYAADGHRCRHNLNYWNSGEWLGIGAGAHSRLCLREEFVDGHRPRISVENIKSPIEWQENVIKFGHGSRIWENLSRKESIEEILLMGLRLRDGVEADNVEKYVQLHSGNISDILNSNYRMLLDKKYIEVSSRNVRVPLPHFSILESIVEKIT
jgi:oxygen-independent coproporphyrinogen-3 oxidase